MLILIVLGSIWAFLMFRFIQSMPKKNQSKDATDASECVLRSHLLGNVRKVRGRCPSQKVAGASMILVAKLCERKM